MLLDRKVQAIEDRAAEEARVAEEEVCTRLMPSGALISLPRSRCLGFESFGAWVVWAFERLSISVGAAGKPRAAAEDGAAADREGLLR
jgi:hypothetical protein